MTIFTMLDEAGDSSQSIGANGFAGTNLGKFSSLRKFPMEHEDCPGSVFPIYQMTEWIVEKWRVGDESLSGSVWKCLAVSDFGRFFS